MDIADASEILIILKMISKGKGLKADIMLLAYALATTASGLLARGGSPGTVLIRTGHMGTEIEGLMFLLGPASPPTAIGWSPAARVQRRAEHHSDPSRAVYSLGSCTKLPELLGRCVLRVLSCRSCKGARNWT